MSIFTPLIIATLAGTLVGSFFLIMHFVKKTREAHPSNHDLVAKGFRVSFPADKKFFSSSIILTGEENQFLLNQAERIFAIMLRKYIRKYRFDDLSSYRLIHNGEFENIGQKLAFRVQPYSCELIFNKLELEPIQFNYYPINELKLKIFLEFILKN